MPILDPTRILRCNVLRRRFRHRIWRAKRAQFAQEASIGRGWLALRAAIASTALPKRVGLLGAFHGARASPHWPYRLYRRPCVRQPAPFALSPDQPDRGAALSGSVFTCIARWAWTHHLRLRALSRRWADSRLVATELLAPDHRTADVAGLRLRHCRLHPGDHQDDPQASDACGRKALGLRPTPYQRRPRRDDPLWLDPRLGGLRPHCAQASRRCRRTADSRGRN